ncbi:uncharacterized protein [Antedon mediterranea]|uniref:uncharacterized protein isoform X2 n=1 Tax=Antedon mediterranea TaxID=105859 RepID=UPI003AF524AD
MLYFESHASWLFLFFLVNSFVATALLETDEHSGKGYIVLISDYQNGVIEHAYLEDEHDTNVSFSVLPIGIRPTFGVSGIAFDPVDSVVYWSDRSKKVIERAYLDGTHRHVIVRNVDASSLALDLVNRRLFFDVNNNKNTEIERSNLDGTGRVTVVKNQNFEIDDVEINKRFVYFSSMEARKIERAVKTSGKQRKTLAEEISPKGLAISSDGKGIYWTDGTSNHVMESDLSGDSKTMVLDSSYYPGLNNTQDVAAIGEYLFVITGDSDRLIRINRNNLQIQDIGEAVFNDPRKIKIVSLMGAFLAMPTKTDSLLQRFMATNEKATAEFAPQCKALGLDEREPLVYNDEAVGTLSKSRGSHTDVNIHSSSSILYSISPYSSQGETCSVSLLWNNSYDNTLIQRVNKEEEMVYFLASRLVSIVTYNVNEDAVANGNTFIHFPSDEIRWKRNGYRTRGTSKPVCTYIDRTSLSFSPDGCKTFASDARKNGVSCSCHEGTSFALLMDISSLIYYPEALLIVTCLATVLSILSLLLIIFGTAIMKRMKHLPEKSLIRNLSIALLLANVALLADTGADLNTYFELTNTMALSIHFSLTSVFVWLFLMIFDLFIKEKFASCRAQNFNCFYQSFGWGMPILISGLSAGLLWDEYAAPEYRSWPDPDTEAIWSMVGPIIFFIAISLLMLLVLIVQSCSASSMHLIKQQERYRRQKRTRLKIGLFTFLLIYISATWSIGVFGIKNIDLQYVFVILNGTIGFVLLLCINRLSKRTKQVQARVEPSIHGQSLPGAYYDEDILMPHSSDYKQSHYNEGYIVTESPIQKPMEKPSRKKYRKETSDTKVFFTEGSAQQEHYQQRTSDVGKRDGKAREKVFREDITLQILEEGKPNDEVIDIEEEYITGIYHKDRISDVPMEVEPSSKRRSLKRLTGSLKDKSKALIHSSTGLGKKITDYQKQKFHGKNKELTKDIQETTITTRIEDDSIIEMVDYPQQLVETERRQTMPDKHETTIIQEKQEIQQTRSPGVRRHLQDTSDNNRKEPETRRTRSPEQQRRPTQPIERHPIRSKDQHNRDVYKTSVTRTEEDYIINEDDRVERRPTRSPERQRRPTERRTGRPDEQDKTKDVYETTVTTTDYVITEDDRREPEDIRRTRSPENQRRPIQPTERRPGRPDEQDTIRDVYETTVTTTDYIITEDGRREPEDIRRTRSPERQRRPTERRPAEPDEQDIIRDVYETTVTRTEDDYIITKGDRKEPEAIRQTRSPEKQRRSIQPPERRPGRPDEQGTTRDVYETTVTTTDYVITEDDRREPEDIRRTRSPEKQRRQTQPAERRPGKPDEQDTIRDVYETTVKSKTEEDYIITKGDRKEPEAIRRTRSPEKERRPIQPTERRPGRPDEQDTIRDVYETTITTTDYVITEDDRREPEAIRRTRSPKKQRHPIQPTERRSGRPDEQDTIRDVYETTVTTTDYVITEDDRREPEDIRRTRSPEKQRRQTQPAERRPGKPDEQDTIRDVYETTVKSKTEEDYIITKGDRKEPEAIRRARSPEKQRRPIQPTERRPGRPDEQDTIRDVYETTIATTDYVITEDDRREPEAIRRTRSPEKQRHPIQPTERRSGRPDEQDTIRDVYETTVTTTDYFITEDDRREPEDVRRTRSPEKQRRQIQPAERRPGKPDEQYTTEDVYETTVTTDYVITEDDRREHGDIRRTGSPERQRRPTERRPGRPDIQDTTKDVYETTVTTRTEDDYIITKGDGKEPEAIRRTRSPEKQRRPIQPTEKRPGRPDEQDTIRDVYETTVTTKTEEDYITTKGDRKEHEDIRRTRSPEKQRRSIQPTDRRSVRPDEQDTIRDVYETTVTTTDYVITEDDRREPEYIRRTRSPDKQSSPIQPTERRPGRPDEQDTNRNVYETTVTTITEEDYIITEDDRREPKDIRRTRSPEKQTRPIQPTERRPGRPDEQDTIRDVYETTVTTKTEEDYIITKGDRKEPEAIRRTMSPEKQRRPIQPTERRSGRPDEQDTTRDVYGSTFTTTDYVITEDDRREPGDIRRTRLPQKQRRPIQPTERRPGRPDEQETIRDVYETTVTATTTDYVITEDDRREPKDTRRTRSPEKQRRRIQQTERRPGRPDEQDIIRDVYEKTVTTKTEEDYITTKGDRKEPGDIRRTRSPEKQRRPIQPTDRRSVRPDEQDTIRDVYETTITTTDYVITEDDRREPEYIRRTRSPDKQSSPIQPTERRPGRPDEQDTNRNVYETTVTTITEEDYIITEDDRREPKDIRRTRSPEKQTRPIQPTERRPGRPDEQDTIRDVYETTVTTKTEEDYIITKGDRKEPEAIRRTMSPEKQRRPIQPTERRSGRPDEQDTTRDVYGSTFTTTDYVITEDDRREPGDIRRTRLPQKQRRPIQPTERRPGRPDEQETIRDVYETTVTATTTDYVITEDDRREPKDTRRTRSPEKQRRRIQQTERRPGRPDEQDIIRDVYEKTVTTKTEEDYITTKGDRKEPGDIRRTRSPEKQRRPIQPTDRRSVRPDEQDTIRDVYETTVTTTDYVITEDDRREPKYIRRTRSPEKQRRPIQPTERRPGRPDEQDTIRDVYEKTVKSKTEEDYIITKGDRKEPEAIRRTRSPEKQRRPIQPTERRPGRPDEQDTIRDVYETTITTTDYVITEDDRREPEAIRRTRSPEKQRHPIQPTERRSGRPDEQDTIRDVYETTVTTTDYVITEDDRRKPEDIRRTRLPQKQRRPIQQTERRPGRPDEQDTIRDVYETTVTTDYVITEDDRREPEYIRRTWSPETKRRPTQPTERRPGRPDEQDTIRESYEATVTTDYVITEDDRREPEDTRRTRSHEKQIRPTQQTERRRGRPDEQDTIRDAYETTDYVITEDDRQEPEDTRRKRSPEKQRRPIQPTERRLGRPDEQETIRDVFETTVTATTTDYFITDDDRREPEDTRRTRSPEKQRRPTQQTERRPGRPDEQDIIRDVYEKTVTTDYVITEDDRREPEDTRRTRSPEKQRRPSQQTERRPGRTDEQDIIRDVDEKTVTNDYVITEDDRREPEDTRRTRSPKRKRRPIQPTDRRQGRQDEQDTIRDVYETTVTTTDYIITEDGRREPEDIRRTRSPERQIRPTERRPAVPDEQDIIRDVYETIVTRTEEDYIITKGDRKEPEAIRQPRSPEKQRRPIQPTERRPGIPDEQDTIRDVYETTVTTTDYVITEDGRKEPKDIRRTRSPEKQWGPLQPTDRRPGRPDEQDITKDVYETTVTTTDYVITEDDKREPEYIRRTRSPEKQRRPHQPTERRPGRPDEQDITRDVYETVTTTDFVITEDDRREPEDRRRKKSPEKQRRPIQPIQRRPFRPEEQETTRDSYETTVTTTDYVITEDDRREPKDIRRTRSPEKQRRSTKPVDSNFTGKNKNTINEQYSDGGTKRDSKTEFGSIDHPFKSQYFPKRNDRRDSLTRLGYTKRFSDTTQPFTSDIDSISEIEGLQLEPQFVKKDVVPLQRTLDKILLEPENILQENELTQRNVLQELDKEVLEIISERGTTTKTGIIAIQGTDIVDKLREIKLNERSSQQKNPSKFDSKKLKFMILDVGDKLTTLERHFDEASGLKAIPLDRPFEAYIVNVDGSLVVSQPFVFSYDRDTATYRRLSIKQPVKYYEEGEKMKETGYTYRKEQLDEFLVQVGKDKIRKCPIKIVENDDPAAKYMYDIDQIKLIIPHPGDDRYDIKYMKRYQEEPWYIDPYPINEDFIEAIVVRRDGTPETVHLLKYESKNTYSIVMSTSDQNELESAIIASESNTKMPSQTIEIPSSQQLESPIDNDSSTDTDISYVIKTIEKIEESERELKDEQIVDDESTQRRRQDIIETTTTTTTDERIREPVVQRYGDRKYVVERREESPQRPRQDIMETTTTTTADERTREPVVQRYGDRKYVVERREESPQRPRQQEIIETTTTTTTTDEIPQKPAVKRPSSEKIRTYVVERRDESPQRPRQQDIIETTTTTTTDQRTREPVVQRYGDRKSVVERREESPQRRPRQDIIETTTTTTDERTREPAVKRPSSEKIRTYVVERREESPQRPRQQDITETTTTTTTDQRTREPVVQRYGDRKSVVQRREESPQRRPRQDIIETTTTTTTDERTREPDVKRYGDRKYVVERREESPQRPRQQEIIETTTTTTTDQRTPEPAVKRPSSEKIRTYVVERREESPQRPRQQDIIETTTTTTTDERTREPSVQRYGDRKSVVERREESPQRPRQDIIETTTTTNTTDERTREPAVKRPSSEKIRTYVVERREESPQRPRQQDIIETTTTTTTDERTREPAVQRYGDRKSVVERREESPQRPRQDIIETTTTTTTTDQRTREPVVKRPSSEKIRTYVVERREESPQRPSQQEIMETTITTTTDQRTREPVVQRYGDRKSVVERREESPQKRPRQDIIETTTTTTTDERTREPAVQRYGNRKHVVERREESPQRPRQQDIIETTTTTTTDDITREPVVQRYGDRKYVVERREESPQRPRQDIIETTTTTTTDERTREPVVQRYGDRKYVVERREESPQRPRQPEIIETTTTTTTDQRTQEPAVKRPSSEKIRTYVVERREESPQRPRQQDIIETTTTTTTDERTREPAVQRYGDRKSVVERREESPQRPRQDIIETTTTTTTTDQRTREPVVKRPSSEKIRTYVVERREESPQRPSQQEIMETTITTTTDQRTREPVVQRYGDKKSVVERREKSPQKRPRQDIIETTTTTTTDERTREPAVQRYGNRKHVVERREESPQRPRQQEIIETTTTTTTDQRTQEPVVQRYGDRKYVVERREESPQRPRQDNIETTTTTTTDERTREPALQRYGDRKYVVERREKSPQRPRQQEIIETTTTTTTDQRTQEPAVKRPSSKKIRTYVVERREESPQRPTQQDIIGTTTTTTTDERTQEPVVQRYGDRKYVVERREESPQRPRQQEIIETTTTTTTDEITQQPAVQRYGDRKYVVERREESPQRPRQQEIIETTTTTTTDEITREPVIQRYGDRKYIVERREESPQRPRQQEIIETTTTTTTDEITQQPAVQRYGDRKYVVERREKSPQRPRQQEIIETTTTTTTDEITREPVIQRYGDRKYVVERREESPQRPRQQEIIETTTTTTTDEITQQPAVQRYGDRKYVVERREKSPQRPRQQEIIETTTTTTTDEITREPVIQRYGDRKYVVERREESPQRPGKEIIETTTTTTTDEITQQPAVQRYGDRKYVVERREKSPQRPRQQEIIETTTTTTTDEITREPAVQRYGDRKYVVERHEESPQRPRQDIIETTTTTTTTDERTQEPAVKRPGSEKIRTYVVERREESPQRPRQQDIIETTTTTTTDDITREPVVQRYGDRKYVVERREESPQRPRQDIIETTTTTTTDEITQQPAVKRPGSEKIRTYVVERREESPQRPRQQDIIETTTTTTTDDITREPVVQRYGDRKYVVERREESPQRPRQQEIIETTTTTTTDERTRQPVVQRYGDSKYVVERREESPQRPRQQEIIETTTTTTTDESTREPAVQRYGDRKYVVERREESPQRPRQQEIIETTTTTTTDERTREPVVQRYGDRKSVVERREESPQRPRQQDIIETTTTTTTTDERTREPSVQRYDRKYVVEKREESPQRPRQQEIIESTTTTTTDERTREPVVQRYGDRKSVVERHEESSQRPRQDIIETTTTTTTTDERTREPAVKRYGDRKSVVERHEESPQRPRQQEIIETTTTTTTTNEITREPAAQMYDYETRKYVIGRREESPQRPRQEIIETTTTTTTTDERTREPYDKETISYIADRREESPRRQRRAIIETTTSTDKITKEPIVQKSDEIISYVVENRDDDVARRHGYVETTTTMNSGTIGDLTIGDTRTWTDEKRVGYPEYITTNTSDGRITDVSHQYGYETITTTTDEEQKDHHCEHCSKPIVKEEEGEVDSELSYVINTIETIEGAEGEVTEGLYITQTNEFDNQTSSTTYQQNTGQQEVTRDRYNAGWSTDQASTQYEYPTGGGENIVINEVGQKSSPFLTYKSVGYRDQEGTSGVQDIQSSSIAHDFTSYSASSNYGSTTYGNSGGVTDGNSAVSGETQAYTDIQTEVMETDGQTFRGVSGGSTSERGRSRFRTQLSGVVLRPRASAKSRYDVDVESVKITAEETTQMQSTPMDYDGSNTGWSTDQASTQYEYPTGGGEHIQSVSYRDQEGTSGIQDIQSGSIAHEFTSYSVSSNYDPR